MNWWIFIGVSVIVVIAAYIHGRACDRLWSTKAEEEPAEPEETRRAGSGPLEGPYRTSLRDAMEATLKAAEQIRKLPLAPAEPSPKPRVYCVECEHCWFVYPASKVDPRCALGAEYEDPIHGKRRRTRDPEKQNKNYDCADFTPKAKR